MEYVNLGATGLKVSRLCLGMMTYGSSKWRDWVLDYEDARPLVARAIEAGINFFDTADIYSMGASEEATGRVLKELGVARHRVAVATKVYQPVGDDLNERGLSRKHIMHAIDDSLKRLGMDYVDLYQIHRFDRATPIEETLEALNDVVRAGKALHIGASSMYAWQFAKMLETSKQRGLAKFVTMQNHYNLIYREEEREMIPLCQSEDIGVLPWSPLARGFLTGSRSRQDKGDTTRSRSDGFAHDMYYEEDDFRVVDRVSEVAAQRGISNAQVALAWLLSKPAVTAPIIGASKMSHLDDAIHAVEIKLSDEEIAALEEPYRPHPVIGHTYGERFDPVARREP